MPSIKNTPMRIALPAEFASDAPGEQPILEMRTILLCENGLHRVVLSESGKLCFLDHTSTNMLATRVAASLTQPDKITSGCLQFLRMFRTAIDETQHYIQHYDEEMDGFTQSSYNQSTEENQNCKSVYLPDAAAFIMLAKRLFNNIRLKKCLARYTACGSSATTEPLVYSAHTAEFFKQAVLNRAHGEEPQEIEFFRRAFMDIVDTPYLTPLLQMRRKSQWYAIKSVNSYLKSLKYFRTRVTVNLLDRCAIFNKASVYSTNCAYQHNNSSSLSFTIGLKTSIQNTKWRHVHFTLPTNWYYSVYRRGWAVIDGLFILSVDLPSLICDIPKKVEAVAWHPGLFGYNTATGYFCPTKKIFVKYT